MDKYILPKQLKKQSFTYQEALTKGVTRYGLIKLLEMGEIERVGRGIYQSVDIELSQQLQFQEATLQLGSPSAICLISALDYFSLTDLVPTQVWVMVDDNKRTSLKHLKLLRCRQPNWNIGIKKKKGYWVTSLERTLVDCLVYKKQVSRSVAIEALRLSLNEKRTTLHKIISMAEKLKVFHLIYPTLEAFA
jgi:predicted transcriptional regulator of viral defense system